MLPQFIAEYHPEDRNSEYWEELDAYVDLTKVAQMQEGVVVNCMISAFIALHTSEAGATSTANSKTYTKDDRSSLDGDDEAVEPRKGSASSIKDMPSLDKGKPVVSVLA